MNKNDRTLVRQLSEGVNVRENLPTYLERLFRASRDVAVMNFTLEYYAFCEELDERGEGWLHSTKDVVLEVQDAVKALLVDDAKGDGTSVWSRLHSVPTPNGEGDGTSVWSRLHSVRRDLLARQEALAAYVDGLSIHEYILNRVEYRFGTESEKERWEEEVASREDEMVTKIMRYIFLHEDDAVIFENIKNVMAQLPIRMTKAKFFEMVAQSLTLYKGSDKSSLERYVYMLRMSGALYKPEGRGKDFEEFGAFLETMERVDYAALTEGEYIDLHVRMEEVTRKLMDSSETCMQLTTLVNNLMAYALTEGHGSTNKACVALARGLFPMVEGNVGRSDAVGKTFEDLEPLLYGLEGNVEKAYEEKILLEAVLEQVGEYKDVLREMEREGAYEALVTLGKLLSGSLYVEIDSAEGTDEVADDDYVKARAEELVREWGERFAGLQRPVVRSIMAAVLSVTPMFYSKAEEVKAFIENAFRSCTDAAEKAACFALLDGVVNDDW